MNLESESMTAWCPALCSGYTLLQSVTNTESFYCNHQEDIYYRNYILHFLSLPPSHSLSLISQMMTRIRSTSIASEPYISVRARGWLVDGDGNGGGGDSSGSSGGWCW